MTTQRATVELTDIERAQDYMSEHLHEVLKTKGLSTMASTHEILGVLEEEFFELKQAVKNSGIRQVVHELEDIGAFCIFATACIRGGTL